MSSMKLISQTYRKVTFVTVGRQSFPSKGGQHHVELLHMTVFIKMHVELALDG